MRRVVFYLAVALAIHLEFPSPVNALDHFKLLDIQVGEQRYVGRVLTHDDRWCWLLERDGQLQKIATDQVTTFTEVGPRFTPQSQAEIKLQLQTELGKKFEVRGTSHYLVAARPGSAEAYADLFEKIYREFVRLFRARGFELVEPEFPLIAVVFPDQLAFANYCAAQGSHVHPGLVGFYVPSSNRVAMYERPNAIAVDHTVIHEATHQVAFNTGVHSRIADHPRWVVEGLATMCEADGIRSRQGSSSPADRINRERFLWFREYSGSRRPVNSLTTFVRDDKLFEKSPLDAYSEAWALSFFLLETKPLPYARYLKLLVDRDALSAYDANARVKDFTEIFGPDLENLDTMFLRFMKRISER